MRTLVSALLIAFAAGATASAAPPDPAAFAAQVRAGELDAARFDFEAADAWSRPAEARAAWHSQTIAALRDGSSTLGCGDMELRANEAMPWLQLAADAPDAARWRANAAALQARVAAMDALIANRESGVADADAAATVIGSMIASLQQSSDARVQELLRRGVRDQSWRFASGVDGAAGLPPGAAAQWTRLVSARLVRIDCANTAWLRAQLNDIRWFDIPTYGERAEQTAWIITQHADRTPEFQREVLARLESLPAGHTNPRNLALLFDRVAVAAGRLQRYATQMHCVGGRMTPINGVEDEAGLAERRAAVGMTSIEDYRARMEQIHPCPAS